MKRLGMLGVIGGAAILTAVPLSLQWSQKNVMLSLDRAEAQMERPLTATNVAGVSRRVHRRAYRRAAYASAGAGVGAYGYGSYYGFSSLADCGYIPYGTSYVAPCGIYSSSYAAALRASTSSSYGCTFQLQLRRTVQSLRTVQLLPAAFRDFLLRVPAALVLVICAGPGAPPAKLLPTDAMNSRRLMGA